MNKAQAAKMLVEIRDMAREELKKGVQRKDSEPSFSGTAKLVETYGYLDGAGASHIYQDLQKAWHTFERLTKAILGKWGFENVRYTDSHRRLFESTLIALRTTDISIELKINDPSSSSVESRTGQRIELKTPRSLIRASTPGKEFLTEFRAQCKGTEYFTSEQVFKAIVYVLEENINLDHTRVSRPDDSANKIKLAKWVTKNSDSQWFVFRFPTLAGELSFSVSVEVDRFEEFVINFPDFFKVLYVKETGAEYLMFDPYDPQQLWDAGTLSRPFAIHYYRAAKFYQYRGFLNPDDTELLPKSKRYADYYNYSGWTADDIIKYNAFVSGEYKDKFEDIHFSMFGSIKYK